MSEYQTANADWHTIELGGVTVPRGSSSVVPTLFIDYPTPGLRTGIAMGPVLVSVEWLLEEPTELPDVWSDVMEVSVVLDGEMTVHGPNEWPIYKYTPESGPYRLRVSARGRELEYDLVASEPLEHYAVQLWPAAEQDDRVIRASTRDLTEVSRFSAPRGGVEAGSTPTVVS